MSKKFVLLLFGPQAAGKYTVGKAVSKHYQAELLDNHHFNNVIMPFVDVNSESIPDICDAVYKMRTLFLNVVKKYYSKEKNASYVFTNLLIDDPMDYQSVEELKQFATEIDACFIPIELICDVDVLCQRLDTKERAERFKLTNKEILKQFLSHFKLAHIEHPNYVAINVTHQKPEETVKAVIDAIEKVSHS